jgi:hypothetical protein
MACKHCCPPGAKPVENPFHDRDALVRGAHDGVSFAVCSYCGQRVLHFWVDVYDDCWHCWCHLDDTETRDLLALPKDDEETLIEQVKQIIRHSNAVLQEHPVRGDAWVPGKACMLGGAPW